jgi:hypothetical protein
LEGKQTAAYYIAAPKTGLPGSLGKAEALKDRFRHPIPKHLMNGSFSNSQTKSCLLGLPNLCADEAVRQLAGLKTLYYRGIFMICSNHGCCFHPLLALLTALPWGIGFAVFSHRMG